jgi:LPPG:FO 2-phospho-L-lactate transferase
VKRGARDAVKEVVYEGAASARPAPGLIEAVREADCVVICPSNPVASVAPILAMPAVRDALDSAHHRVVGISPIVAGAPLRGMADKLMPVAGLEVSCAGAARAYDGLLAAWVIDERDARSAPSIESTGVRVGVTDTIMVNDAKAEALARFALELLA